MEVPFARWPAADRQRGTRPDPKNEVGEPALGRYQDPWRVAQARHRGRSVHGLGLHGAAARSTIAKLGRPSFATIWMGLRRLICLWFQRLPFNSCTHFSFLA